MTLGSDGQMGIDGFESKDDDDAHCGTYTHDHKEATVPTVTGCEPKSDRQTQNLRGGKRTLDESHDAPAEMQRKDVSNNSHASRANNASEKPRHNPRDEQILII